MTYAQIKKKEAEIKAILDKQIFVGWSGESSFLQYSWQDFRRYCHGELCIAIGSNSFGSTLDTVLRMAIAHESYQATKKQLYAKMALTE